MRAYDVVQTVLEPIVLRRTKTMRDQEGNLLVKNVEIEYLDFTPQEQDIYDSLFTDSSTKFSYFCAAGKALSNYASIFQLLMRLRQVSCHPYLVVKDGINKQVLSEVRHVLTCTCLITQHTSDTCFLEWIRVT
jgi:DNA repair protein RAD5